MSYYKTCPDCGANLDPGEICDCRKKKNGLPDTTQISPKKGKKPSHKHNIAQRTEFVKTLSVPAPENPLREYRISHNIPVKEMVAAVRRRYPKYDKHLHSKCEHTELYGVQLCNDAQVALVAAFDPDVTEPQPEKKTRHGVHLRTKTISCRLDDDVHEKLLRYTREDGYEHMQDWLEETVVKYVKKKYFEEVYNRGKAREAQRKYCEENGVPFFVRYVCICPRCDRDIFYPAEHPDGSVTGITVEGAGKGHITYCPHCRASFID